MPRKKRKKGTRPNQRRTATRQDSTSSVQIPRPRVTGHLRLSAVPVIPGASPPSPYGNDGRYYVEFILGIPGVSSVVQSLNTRQLRESGDSLLMGHGFDIELGDDDHLSLGFVAVSNRHGRIAKIHTYINATNFESAEQQAYDAVMPVLSNLALAADVPLEVKATLIVEEATQVQVVVATVMGRSQPVPNVSAVSTIEIRPLLAAYREGLNCSGAPLYQALCFWKILEGVEARHTRRVRQSSKAGKASPPDPMMLCVPANDAGMPSDVPWALDSLRPYMGASFKSVKDDTEEAIRNAVVHITPGKDIRVADYFLDVEQCRRVIPVLRYIARSLIDNELAAVDEVPTDSQPYDSASMPYVPPRNS